jgi:hypothetical protein
VRDDFQLKALGRMRLGNCHLWAFAFEGTVILSQGRVLQTEGTIGADQHRASDSLFAIAPLNPTFAPKPVGVN